MERWETHRGDEWWYSDFWLEASASTGPTFISIGSIKMKNGQLTESLLHEFLWGSQQQFRESQVLCHLDDITKPLIQSLSEKGLVRWEIVQHPYSQDARLLSVEQPKKKVT
jgi:hypothetical protein